MISITVIFCLILQTAVALYLLHSSLADDDFERYLKMFLIIFLVHLCTKYFLLAVLHNSLLYGKLASGFSLFYGPYVMIMAKLLLNRPMSLKMKIVHLLPFIIFSVVYVGMIVGAAVRWIPETFIITYEQYYQWIVLISLAGYPVYVTNLLHINRCGDRVNRSKWQLVNQICFVLLSMVGLLIILKIVSLSIFPLSAYFDFRTFAYAWLVSIPILILRYKLKKDPVPVPNANLPATGLIMTQPAIAEPPANPMSPAPVASKDISLSPEIKPVKKYEKSGINDFQMDEYHKILTAYMEKSKAYLNTELSLDDLAHNTRIPKHHITQMLNYRLNKSFYLFINEYRIKEAIRLLETETKESNFLSLAFDCGFNSKSSFNKYFKKITDQTPSSYRQMIAAS